MRRLIVTSVPLVLLVAVMQNRAAAAEATKIFDVGVAPCDLDTFPACEPAQSFSVITEGVLRAQVDASSANCTAITVRFEVDGALLYTSDPIASGGSTGVIDLGPVTPGTHTLTVGADVPFGINCDSRGWSGALSVTVSGVISQDTKFANPGDTVTVSTAIATSPRPAGISATLYRSGDAAMAQISVVTYDGLPSGLPPSPIRAVGYLDLQLTNPHVNDVIVSEFIPNDPVLPPNPIVPPNPILPPSPILPPNPIRLAWWDGLAWSPVFESPGHVPTYSSTSKKFSVTFSDVSSPAITALGGTVFAMIPGYYFRGFGTPVDSSMLNVAKAGRAIPLKWQVFDAVVEPVLDLDPAIVKVSSVAIPCEQNGTETGTIEEYATGESGLQNLGDGVYQINWATSRSYAGTCRRLRLDLGERNPDGTPFYRTADFHFTR